MLELRALSSDHSDCFIIVLIACDIIDCFSLQFSIRRDVVGDDPTIINKMHNFSMPKLFNVIGSTVLVIY